MRSTPPRVDMPVYCDAGNLSRTAAVESADHLSAGEFGTPCVSYILRGGALPIRSQRSSVEGTDTYHIIMEMERVYQDAMAARKYWPAASVPSCLCASGQCSDESTAGELD